MVAWAAGTVRAWGCSSGLAVYGSWGLHRRTAVAVWLGAWRCRRAAGPVVGERAGGKATAAQGDAASFEIARRFQLVERPADGDLALAETQGQRLGGDGCAIGERLDVDGEPGRCRGQARVLGQVIADHRVPVNVPVPYVEDSRAGRPFRERGRGQGRAKACPVNGLGVGAG